MSASYYDAGLVPDDLKHIGTELRKQLEVTTKAVLQVTQESELLETYPEGRHGIDARNPYMDPINLLQVELLRRLRAIPEGQPIEPAMWEAFVVTVNGVAAGMRNTG
jgi:phosphoenolpyruvate carboxylase